LPNITAHNETCANIGNVLWNWRMLQITGEAKYADIIELELYNAVLSGISMDGNKFFYTNPLAASKDYPYNLRWSGERSKYISKSNCCPPNTIRTIAEVNNYMYSIADDGLYMNLYGGSNLKTKLKDGSAIQLEQITNYPWDGNIVMLVKEAPAMQTNFFLRIPAWCKNASIKVNGKLVMQTIYYGAYNQLKRVWKAGDKIELQLAMPATLIEANPLIEETKNQVAVKRGPLVYCLESADLPSAKVFDVLMPANIKLQTVATKIDNANIIALQGQAEVLQTQQWKNTLYKELNTASKPITVKLIPYYAWANRGLTDMTVWLPLKR